MGLGANYRFIYMVVISTKTLAYRRGILIVVCNIVI